MGGHKFLIIPPLLQDDMDQAQQQGQVGAGNQGQPGLRLFGIDARYGVYQYQAGAALHCVQQGP